MALFRRGLLTAVIVLVLFFLYPLGNQAQAVPNTSFEPLDHSHDLMIDNKNYTIRYGFVDDKGVKLESMTADYNTKTITVKIDDENPDHAADFSMTDWEKRVFIIELSRNIVNANTTEAGQGCSVSIGANVVWSQEHDIEYHITVNSLSNINDATQFTGHLGGELCGEQLRTLSISYPYGKSIIVIQGTVMIPEFGFQASFLLFTFGMIGAGIVAQRFADNESR